MAIARKSLGDILVEKQFILPDQLQQALETQRKTPGSDLANIILQNGFAAEVDVYRAKAEAENLPFVDLTKHKPEAPALNIVPQNLVTKYNALPVKKDGQT